MGEMNGAKVNFMEFKSGKIVKEFNIRNKSGQTMHAVFRFPKISFAGKMVKWINKMRNEALWLGNWKKETLKSEKKFIRNTLKEMKQRKGFHVVVQLNGIVVGGATIHPKPYDAQKHVGVFGIGLLKEYTGKGIGFELGKTTLQIAKKHTRFAVIESSYNSNNKASQMLHKKLGFTIAGNIPRGIKGKNGKFGNEVILYKKIK